MLLDPLVELGKVSVQNNVSLADLIRSDNQRRAEMHVMATSESDESIIAQVSSQLV